MIIIYDGPDACQKCLGWKQIANDNAQSSWKYWAELPMPATIAVQMGMVFPIDCPRCMGTGVELSATARQTRLHHTLDLLQSAWDALGRCVDEFTPDHDDACSDYHDALDTAILAVLTAWKES